MNIVLKTDDRILLSLAPGELLGITNALNEICHGIQIPDAAFQTRLGVSKESMSSLLVALQAEAHPSRQTGELVEAWEESGSVMVRVLGVFGDPIELSEAEAATFAGQLQQAISQAS